MTYNGFLKGFIELPRFLGYKGFYKEIYRVTWVLRDNGFYKGSYRVTRDFELYGMLEINL